MLLYVMGVDWLDDHGVWFRALLCRLSGSSLTLCVPVQSPNVQ